MPRVLSIENLLQRLCEIFISPNKTTSTNENYNFMRYIFLIDYIYYIFFNLHTIASDNHDTIFEIYSQGTYKSCIKDYRENFGIGGKTGKDIFMQVNTKLVTNNLLWRFAERCGAQGVAFVVSIILARLIAPETYGTIAIVTVFITILNVFVDSGMANALIQKKEPDDLDFSTVFFFNVFICLVLYAVTFLAAPLIASFYNDASLVSVLRVLSLIIVISGVRNVQQAYVSKHMIFKKFFYATIFATLGSAVVGICMAYSGLGIWALVGQQLSNSFFGTVFLWLTVKWRPKWMFSFSRLKGLFSYGWKLFVSSMIDTLYIDIRQLIIGKMYSSNDLAFYNRGQQFPQLIVNNINSSFKYPFLAINSSKRIIFTFGYDVDLSCSISAIENP